MVDGMLRHLLPRIIRFVERGGLLGMVVDDIPGSGKNAGSGWRKAGCLLVSHQRSTQPRMVHIPSKPPDRCETTTILMLTRTAA